MSEDNKMNKAGDGKVGELWHSQTVDKWVVTKNPYSSEDRHALNVGNEEDAIAIGRLLEKSRSGVFITHVVETHYHLLPKGFTDG